MHGRSVPRLAAPTALAALVAASAASGLAADPAAAAAAPPFQVINATVAAAADHEQVGTSAFPNFSEGAVNNRYPLAQARVDGAPSASSRASWADTGPLGQSVAAEEGAEQPQYASAKYPPGRSKPNTAGHRGGPYAEAMAVKNKARAYATEASAQTSTSGPPGVRQLEAALDAWRSRFLTAEARNKHAATESPAKNGAVQPAAQPGGSASPEPSASPSSEPEGADGLTAAGAATFDPAKGVLTVVGDSRVARASYARGLIQLRGVHVHVEVVNDGSPAKQVAVEIGAAEINGVPVSIDHEGVSIAANNVPTKGPVKQANAALNRVLTNAGVHVRAVRPQTETSGHRMTVHASGVKIAFRQIFSPPGAPEQNLQHTVGEVSVDSLAVPGNPRTAAPAPPVTDTGDQYAGAVTDGGGPTDSSGGRRWVPGTPGSTGLSAGSAQGAGQAGEASSAAAPAPEVAAAVTPTEKPLWLLLLYFLWQSTVIGAAASLWWWRMSTRGTLGEG